MGLFGNFWYILTFNFLGWCWHDPRPLSRIVYIAECPSNREAGVRRIVSRLSGHSLLSAQRAWSDRRPPVLLNFKFCWQFAQFDEMAMAKSKYWKKVRKSEEFSNYSERNRYSIKFSTGNVKISQNLRFISEKSEFDYSGLLNQKAPHSGRVYQVTNFQTEWRPRG